MDSGRGKDVDRRFVDDDDLVDDTDDDLLMDDEFIDDEFMDDEFMDDEFMDDEFMDEIDRVDRVDDADEERTRDLEEGVVIEEERTLGRDDKEEERTLDLYGEDERTFRADELRTVGGGVEFSKNTSFMNDRISRFFRNESSFSTCSDDVFIAEVNFRSTARGGSSCCVMDALCINAFSNDDFRA